MRVTKTHFTLIATRRHKPVDIHEELQWLGRSLGLFTERDKEKSCFRIFIELLKSTKSHQTMTSDDIAFRLGLARGTVVHHLNKLIEARLVMPYRRTYGLRHENLEKVIEQMENDAKIMFEQLKSIARIVDKKMDKKS